MLFGYPLEATSDNWLHECIIDAMVRINSAADVGAPYIGWPQVVKEDCRRVLVKRRGLRDKLAIYDAACRELSPEERGLVAKALEEQNDVENLLSGVSDCQVLEDLPAPIRVPIAELFEYLFNLLSELGIRDAQYRSIYFSSEEHLCPFCGTENFDAPGAPREDLDHYLPRSKYPLASINLMNLVPMGHKCNSRYKHSIDIIRDDLGGRRVAFFPYEQRSVALSLLSSEPFGGVTENTPLWDIEFVPSGPEIQTWDDIFDIKIRYGRDHLDPEFKKWLSLFSGWARRSGLVVESNVGVIGALREFEANWSEAGISDRAFLKAAVFGMLRHHCEQGNERLTSQMRDLVSPPGFMAVE